MTPLRERGTVPPPRDNDRRATAMGSAAWAAGELGVRVAAFEAAVAIVCRCALGLGFFGRPPDEPERAEDRDLQHDEEKEDWPEPAHGAQCRDKAHCRKAST